MFDKTHQKRAVKAILSLFLGFACSSQITFPEHNDRYAHKQEFLFRCAHFIQIGQPFSFAPICNKFPPFDLFAQE
jgi:hypothetical protein